MELIKHQPQNRLLPSLIAAIKNDGSFDLTAVNKAELSLELRKFKTEKGQIDFPALFKIPKENRITGMSAIDFPGTVQVISVAISLSLQSINLKRPMTTGQVFDLAEAIIEDAAHDNISFEDIMLFLQKMVRGEYGEMYESMDVPKFMHWFGQYRDARWDEGIKLRDERDAEFKRVGDDNYFERANRSSPIGEELSRYTNKIQIQKDELKLKEAELRKLREQNNF